MRDGAVLLDMGEFVFQQPVHPDSSRRGQADGIDQDLPSNVVAARAIGGKDRLIKSNSLERARSVLGAPSQQQAIYLRMYQILSPNMVWRGRVFGSFLALKPEDWKPVDASYFAAPGENEHSGAQGWA